MISKTAGILLKKNIKTKAWWLKLSVALVLSNLFFFILFRSSPVHEGPPQVLKSGWVEVQLEAQLLTPFQNGKKVILLHRKSRQQLEGMLKGTPGSEGTYTLWVKEAEAHMLFHHSSWEILPYLKDLKLPLIHRGADHEIRY